MFSPSGNPFHSRHDGDMRQRNSGSVFRKGIPIRSGNSEIEAFMAPNQTGMEIARQFRIQVPLMPTTMFDRLIVPLLATSLGMLISMGGMWALGDPGDPSPEAPWLSESGEPTAAWRYTADGWQDSSAWRVGENESRIKFIDQIHPTVVAGLVLLLCVGVGLYFDRKSVANESDYVCAEELPERL